MKGQATNLVKKKKILVTLTTDNRMSIQNT